MDVYVKIKVVVNVMVNFFKDELFEENIYIYFVDLGLMKIKMISGN